MLNLKRNMLSAALASAIMAMAAGVHAQTTTESEEEDELKALDGVVVTGIRAGIENAIETKQDATSIVEAISAEDIGKLPDVSIADSIARLPGLTAQRDRGRAQEINIRGFAGDFSTTTLNGREQVSLGNNRGVEFDQYPSELINQVVVYKTPDASLVGQGLSGTVDLQTVRPLSFPERAIAVNARIDQHRLEDDKENGNRFSLSYIDQFADDTVGLALGYARLNNPSQGNQFEAWGYDNGVLGGGKLYDFENENQRDGFLGVLEYRPSDSYSTILDLYYSKFDKEEFKRGMEFGLVWGSAGPPTSSTVDPVTGTTTSATFDNFDPVLRNDFNGAEDDLLSVGWNQVLELDNNWTLTTDLSYSDAKRDERILETYAGLLSGLTDSIGIDFNPDGYFDFDFGLDYADPSILRLTDAGGWGQDGYIKDFEVKDSLTAARVDLERRFDSGAISAIEFGLNYTDREKSRASNEAFLCLNVCRDGTELPIPNDLIGDSSFDFAGLPGILGYDARRALETLYNLPPNFNADIANKNWKVDETLTTVYFKANIDTELGTLPMRGNIGIQVVDVDQSSDGFATYEGNPVGDPISGGDSYRTYLPSMNLIFSLPQDQMMRFALGRQMARPRMDDMRASAGYGINQAGRPDLPQLPPGPVYSGGGGNPELRPWIANAIDLSYEKYFGGKGYFSIAWFHKDLRSYVYEQDFLFDFAGLVVPPGTPPEFIPSSTLGVVRAPLNGEGGTLKGFEFALSIPFSMLWEPLEGFGMQSSYTDSSTSIQPDGPETAGPLPGFSKYTSNVTLYYERYGFSARASRRSRSEFLGEVQGFGGDRTRVFFEGESVLDLQLGYQIQSGTLKDLSFLFQVSNLGDEPFRSNFDGIDDRPRQYFEYGRNYLFGVNYRF